MSTNKCGKYAGSLIPRLGMYYACVLEPGHEGGCQKGGTCFKHGDYIGEHCPKWPDCIPTAEELLNTSPLAAFQKRAVNFQNRLTGEATEETGKVWWASVLFRDVLANEFFQVYRDLARTLEEKMKCGHRRANEVGDDGGTPYCEVCAAETRNVFTNCRIFAERIVDILRRGDAEKMGMDRIIELILFMTHNTKPLEERLAQARLEEFDYIKANRPIDPSYWDEHHRKALEEQACPKQPS